MAKTAAPDEVTPDLRTPDGAGLTSELLEWAGALTADRLGLAYPESRLSELERALTLACGDSSTGSVTEFLGALEATSEDHANWRRFARSLTIGETYFFREAATLENLEREALVPLIERRRADGDRRLRLWSAACSTGEEPYTLAIMIDRLLPDLADWNVTILATDVDSEALGRARAARYRRRALHRTAAEVKARYFTARGKWGVELDPRIAAMVTFAELNLASGSYPSLMTNTTVMDVILCRNVLIYMTREVQRAMGLRLARCLALGGWLAVSPVEAAQRETFEPLAAVSLPGGVLFRNVPQGQAPAESVVPTDRPAELAPIVAPSIPPAEPIPEPEPAREPVPEPARGPEPEPEPVPAVAVEPEEQPSALDEARALADRGELDEAVGLCEAELDRDLLSVEARILLAVVHQERGDLSAMASALRAVIYVAPDSVAANFFLGCALHGLGRAAEGRRALKLSVQLLGEAADETEIQECDGLTAGQLRATVQEYGGQQ